MALGTSVQQIFWETILDVVPYSALQGLMRVGSLPSGKMLIYLGCLKIKFIAIELTLFDLRAH
jgi:hypothetical protein